LCFPYTQLFRSKTYLYLRSLENASETDKAELINWFASKEGGQEKIEAVKSLFQKTNATADTQLLIEEYTQKALLQLETLEIPIHFKEELKEFALSLMSRTV